MQTNQKNPQNREPFGSQLAWFAAGFVLPFYSVEFYLTAIRKRLRSAILFFTAMMTIVTVLSVIRLSLQFEDIRSETFAAVEAGEFPEITIEEGTATIVGEDPFLLTTEKGYFLAVDTGGALKDREELESFSGILLAKNELRMYNTGEYQGIPLEDYNTRLNIETIKIDGKMIADNFGFFTTTFLFTSAIGIWTWNVFLWLLFLNITTYFLWGPLGQSVEQFTFRTVLTIGIYAHLPAYMINYVLKLFGVNIVFLYTMLLMAFWVGAIYLVLKELAAQAMETEKAIKSGDEAVLPELPTPRLWPAVLGLPLFTLIALNAINHWDFAPNYILGGLVLTITGLLVIDSIGPRIQDPSKSEK